MELLVRRAPLGASAADRPSFEESITQLFRSETVLRRVAQASGLPVTPESVSSANQILMTPNGDLLAVKLRGRDAAETARLANAFGDEASAAVRSLLVSQCEEAGRELQEKLAAVDRQLAQTSRELVEFQSRTMGVDFDGAAVPVVRLMSDLERKAETIRSQVDACDLQVQNLNREITRLTPSLAGTREALAQALMRYTEEHPKVKELRAAVESIEAQCAAQSAQGGSGIAVLGSPAAVGLYTRATELRSQRASLVRELEAVSQQRQELQGQMTTLPENQAKYVRLKSQYEALKDQRFVLARRQQEVQLTGQGGLECVKVIERASVTDLNRSEKVKAGLLWGSIAGAIGLLAAGLLAVTAPSSRRRIRSGEDLEDATQLPLLAALGDLGAMSPEERQQWAVRTFTVLRGRFAEPEHDSLVCGFISAAHGEGRSTWINLLGDGASRLGYQVLNLSASDPARTPELVRKPEPTEPLSESVETPLKIGELTPVPLSPRAPLAPSVPPASWAWNLQHREQWRAVLQQWKAVDRLVVFVELPPASVPEAVLLAEGLPNLVWLCRKDMVRSTETRLHLGTLRHGRANLVGCALNRARAADRAWFPGLLVTGLLFLAVLAGRLHGQETNTPIPSAMPPPTNATGVVSLSAPDRLAPWQKRLTLGPGDVVDVSLYEQPDTSRPSLAIGPDGRINYLEARDVTAAGLTIDELRARLEGVLSKYHRAPRVVIIPTAYLSKKYYLLGNVNQRGVYLLDRPVSVVEAIAKAGGFVAPLPSMTQRNPMVQADLQRSFLVRRGPDDNFYRVAVDFEALFQQGDLVQNIALEPDDYLFFPPVDLQEIYVLGSVALRGVVPYTVDVTAIGAIAARGGFTDRAWRQKVLVVRGSLNHPQTFIVDAAAILSARAPDFPLKNRDIVYVHEKPWAKAQELVEYAALSFANAFVIGATTGAMFPSTKQ